MSKDFKTTVLGEPVQRVKNTLLYYDKEANRVIRTVTYPTLESARAEYNRITCTHKGRPWGSIDTRSRSHRPCATVHYFQLIIG